MACTAEKVIKTAKAENGYRETGTNKTKYADYFDKKFPNFYNYEKQGTEWCELFVDYCVLVNCDSEEEAEYILCQPKKSAGAGCKQSYDYYKKAGRTGKEPRLGAQIYFGSDTPKHTGVVIDITADSVITEEGNSENQVKKHTYKKTSSKIYGYGYPRYTEQAAAEPEPVPEPTPAPAPTPSIKTPKYAVKTFTGAPLRLRAKPNTKSKVLALMKNGSTIEVESINNGWAKAKFNGKTGYCTANRIVKK